MKSAALYLCSSLFCILAWPGVASSQPATPLFQNFTVDEGLPQNSINCIYQDRHGFMWFGTQDGLCRFDGYEFKVYRHDPLSSNSPGNNYIWDIYEDKDGALWVCSFGGGLTRFNPDNGVFQHFKRQPENPGSLSNNNTFSSVRAGDAIWVGTNDGLCKLDVNRGEVKCFLQVPGNEQGHAGNYINPVVFQAPNLLWMRSDSGLTRFNIQTEKADFFSTSPFDSGLDLSKVQHIHIHENKVLLTTESHFVALDFERKTQEILLSASDVSAESPVNFKSFLPPKEGSFWLASNQGLIRFLTDTGLHQLHTHNKEDRNSLPHNFITSLFRSSDGIVWIGTRSGLAKLDREKSEFQLIRSQPGKGNTLSHNSVKGIVEDADSLIWLATVDGLNILNRKSGHITVFQHQPHNPNTLSNNYLLSIALSNDGTMWAGTRGAGLNKLIWDRNKPMSTAFFQRYELGGARIQSILDDNENLWLGSSGNGLIRFDKATGKTKTYERSFSGSGPSHSYVYYLLKDSFGNFWLGTATGGLNLFNPQTERFLYFRNADDNLNSLCNDIVLCIHEDRNKQLWIGTASGLSRLKNPLEKNLFAQFQSFENLSKEHLFENYSRRHGLPNEVIYGILEDEEGFLWLSTNEGLAKFDPAKGKVVKVYDVNDGLQSNEFNQNAFFKNQQGEFYFGGGGGVNIFKPGHLRGNTTPPPVHITGFSLYNEPVPLQSNAADSDFFLAKAPHQTEEIKLAYHHDVITFSFVALNYINTQKNKYLYKLEGFNNTWIEANDNRMATYTNLDAGEYTFRVKACNNDGVWNDAGASLRLIVTPPPWKTWYAYLTYFLLFALAVYGFVRQRIRASTRAFHLQAQIEKAKSEERERFRKKSAQDFHDEVGNKITKINLFTELAKTETTDQNQLGKYLEKIEQNTSELSAGMRDFIWSMDTEKDNLFDTLLRLRELGSSMFTDAGVNFSIIGLQSSFQKVQLHMDTRRTLLLIFKEAMNNCAKYANAKQVVLSVHLNESRLEIQLRDDGIGFDPTLKENQQGYGTKIMKDRAEKIGGKLEIISAQAKGTSIHFQANIPQTGDCTAP